MTKSIPGQGRMYNKDTAEFAVNMADELINQLNQSK